MRKLSEIISEMPTAKMTEFIQEHGLPVIFVIFPKHEGSEDAFEDNATTKFFKKDQMHEAADFARNNNGELGVYDPKWKKK